MCYYGSACKGVSRGEGEITEETAQIDGLTQAHSDGVNEERHWYESFSRVTEKIVVIATAWSSMHKERADDKVELGGK